MALPEIMKRTPNIASICVDEVYANTIRGCVYTMYEKKAFDFEDIAGLVNILENVMDAIRYPEATVHFRSFKGAEGQKAEMIDCIEKQMSVEELLEKAGRVDTLVMTVESRNNATWQGKIYSSRCDETCEFASELGAFKFINTKIIN